jgi:hypothetical protein
VSVSSTAIEVDSNLPIEVRAAIDLVAARCTDAGGEIAGTILGAKHLQVELDRYARHIDADFRIIALDCDPDRLARSLATHNAHEVWCVTAGPIHRLIRPMRQTRRDYMTNAVGELSDEMREHGFARSARFGIEGPGYIFWAVAERVLRRLQRPDLADRCRVAMLRSLITMAPFHAGAISVTSFRRREATRG